MPPGGMQRPPGDPALRHQASADAQAGPAALFRSYVAIPILPPLRSAAGYVRRPLGAAARVWRRSIQLRVVATTLLLSLGVVLLLGCLALILKAAGVPHMEPGTGFVWVAHGYLYLVYVVVTAMLGVKLRWPLPRYVLVMLAGTIPTMSFVAEHFVTRACRAAAAA